MQTVRMSSLPDSYVDLMPSDPDLFVELGRVAWAAARLHFGVRDAINRHPGGCPYGLVKRQGLGVVGRWCRLGAWRRERRSVVEQAQ